MRTLGFDSTSAVVTAALIHDGEIESVFSAHSNNTHSTTLLPTIEGLLKLAGIKVSELSLISCTTGPGSFTGVRIGTSTAKGLAVPHNISCIGVSSLAAMAEIFAEIRGLICPMIDARRGNVYSAVFYSDGNGIPVRLKEDSLVARDELPSFIEEVATFSGISGETLYFTGDGADAAYISAHKRGSEIFTPSQAPMLLKMQNGYGAAKLGERIYKDAEKSSADMSIFDSAKLVPVYLRKSQAEREHDEKTAGNNLQAEIR